MLPYEIYSKIAKFLPEEKIEEFPSLFHIRYRNEFVASSKIIHHKLEKFIFKKVIVDSNIDNLLLDEIYHIKVINNSVKIPLCINLKSINMLENDFEIPIDIESITTNSEEIFDLKNFNNLKNVNIKNIINLPKSIKRIQTDKYNLEDFDNLTYVNVKKLKFPKSIEHLVLYREIENNFNLSSLITLEIIKNINLDFIKYCNNLKNLTLKTCSTIFKIPNSLEKLDIKELNVNLPDLSNLLYIKITSFTITFDSKIGNNIIDLMISSRGLNLDLSHIDHISNLSLNCLAKSTVKYPKAVDNFIYNPLINTNINGKDLEISKVNIKKFINLSVLNDTNTVYDKLPDSIEKLIIRKVDDPIMKLKNVKYLETYYLDSRGIPEGVEVLKFTGICNADLELHLSRIMIPKHIQIKVQNNVIIFFNNFKIVLNKECEILKV